MIHHYRAAPELVRKVCIANLPKQFFDFGGDSSLINVCFRREEAEKPGIIDKIVIVAATARLFEAKAMVDLYDHLMVFPYPTRQQVTPTFGRYRIFLGRTVMTKFRMRDSL